MTEEKEFSFVRFLKFTLRYFLIGVLLVGLGLGIGAATALASKSTSYEKYTGSMTLNVAHFAALAGLSTTDSTVLTSQAAQIMETAGSIIVKSRTFEALQDELYPSAKSKSDKLKLFNPDLVIKYGTDSLTVNFIYDVTPEPNWPESQKRALAQKVVQTYLAFAAQTVREQYAVFASEDAFAAAFSLSRIQQSYELSESILDSNRGVSLLKRAAIGGIAGAALAAVLIFVLYLFDPRIKSVEDVLPPAKAAVLRAEDEGAAVKLMARAKLAKARRIAVVTLCQDEAYATWVEALVSYLKRSGASIKVVTFDANSADWLTYFQNSNAPITDYELYFYNADNTEIAAYIASNADFSAFFVDQRRVMAKVLQKSVESVSGDSYSCTVIHNTDRAYVG